MQKLHDPVEGTYLQARLRLYHEREVVLGWGKIMLLKQVSETGSIAEAARRMDISYNHAWRLIRHMNQYFTKPLVDAARGGGENKGASLSATGETVLRLYQEMTSMCLEATHSQWCELRSLIKGTVSLDENLEKCPKRK